MLPMTLEKRKQFIQEDFYDALRWLFVGAVSWTAHKEEKDCCPNLDALGMFTNAVQARSLYEFYFAGTRGARPDDARVEHFTSSWTETSTLYSRYMCPRAPAQKRVFHLVYYRSTHSGGAGHAGSDHLNEQVLNVAKDIYLLTNEFAKCARTEFRRSVRSALRKAKEEADKVAEDYQLDNPLWDQKGHLKP
jgi:hypothetical protein